MPPKTKRQNRLRVAKGGRVEVVEVVEEVQPAKATSEIDDNELEVARARGKDQTKAKAKAKPKNKKVTSEVVIDSDEEPSVPINPPVKAKARAPAKATSKKPSAPVKDVEESETDEEFEIEDCESKHLISRDLIYI